MSPKPAPIPHTRQIRNLSVSINVFYLLVSKIWALRLKFQNVTKIGGFNPYYFTTGLLQLLCSWSLYFLSIPSQSILNVFPEGEKNNSLKNNSFSAEKSQSFCFPQNKVYTQPATQGFLEPDPSLPSLLFSPSYCLLFWRL